MSNLNFFNPFTDSNSGGGGGTVDAYTKEETNILLARKANQSTTYTKVEVDTALSTKADQATTYTKTEVDNIIPDVEHITTSDIDLLFIQ